MRSPIATRSPGFLLKTMRRAISPAICLKTTVVPSPVTVTMFCSFSRGALFPAGHQKLALLVMHLLDDAADRSAVHVHVEDVQKDADPVEPAFRLDGDHLAVGRRNGHRPGRNLAVRVAEEIEAEKGQQDHRGRKPGSGQPADQGAGGAECKCVIDTSGYDLQTTIFACARGRGWNRLECAGDGEADAGD